MSETLNDALIDEIRDLYNAEKQLTKALPKMAKHATNEALRSAIESHLAETEGQITRLKLIKRQGYGRAGFDLLRQRVLCAA